MEVVMEHKRWKRPEMWLYVILYVIIADKSYRLTSLDGLLSKGGDWDRQAATATNGKDKDRYPWKWNDQVPSSTSPWNHCQQTTGPENFAISHQVPSRVHSWMWTNPLSPECLVYNEPHTLDAFWRLQRQTWRRRQAACKRLHELEIGNHYKIICYSFDNPQKNSRV